MVIEVRKVTKRGKIKNNLETQIQQTPATVIRKEDISI